MSVGSAGAVDWAKTILYGLIAMLATGIVFGLMSLVMFESAMLAGIVAGIVVAVAVKAGAGRVTWGVVGLAVLLIFLAVFLGNVLAFSILAKDYGLTPIDILANYPLILSLAPVVAVITYLSGGIGAVVAALWLHKQMGTRGRPAGSPWVLD